MNEDTWEILNCKLNIFVTYLTYILEGFVADVTTRLFVVIGVIVVVEPAGKQIISSRISICKLTKPNT